MAAASAAIWWLGSIGSQMTDGPKPGRTFKTFTKTVYATFIIVKRTTAY